jgi:hypothetical protein
VFFVERQRHASEEFKRSIEIPIFGRLRLVIYLFTRAQSFENRTLPKSWLITPERRGYIITVDIFCVMSGRNRVSNNRWVFGSFFIFLVFINYNVGRLFLAIMPQREMLVISIELVIDAACSLFVRNIGFLMLKLMCGAHVRI